MRIDGFTKVVLLAIAIFLGIIALRPILQPETAFGNPGSYDYVRPVAGAMGVSIILDTRNGNLWVYDFDESKFLGYGGKLTKLGEPIQKKK